MSTCQQSLPKTSGLGVIICGLAALFYVYDYFIQVAPSIMTHQLMAFFHIGAASLGVLSASFYASYMLMQIPSGILLDRLGARILLSIAVLISAAGVTLFGLAHSFWLAALARFLIGLGSAAAFISALFLVSRWFSHHHFVIIAGLIQLAGCLGSIFGLAPLALTINHFGWQQTLLVVGILTFALSIIFYLVIRDSPGKTATIKAQHSFAGEWQRLRLLTNRPQVWWVAAVGFLSWVPVAVIGALWGVQYLMKAYHLSNVVAGRWCSLFWLGLGFGSPIAGWYTQRIRKRCSPIVLCFAVGLLAALIIICAGYLPLWLVAAAYLLLGASASVQALTFGIIKDIVPEKLFGTAAGINNMAAILGGAISQPLAGFMLRWLWQGQFLNGVPDYSLLDFRYTFLLLIFTAAAGVWVARFKLQETRCEIQSPGLHSR